MPLCDASVQRIEPMPGEINARAMRHGDPADMAGTGIDRPARLIEAPDARHIPDAVLAGKGRKSFSDRDSEAVASARLGSNPAIEPLDQRAAHVLDAANPLRSPFLTARLLNIPASVGNQVCPGCVTCLVSWPAMPTSTCPLGQPRPTAVFDVALVQASPDTTEEDERGCSSLKTLCRLTLCRFW